MSVFKEINKADGSGVTQFFRLSTEKQTVETNDYGDFYNFKGGVASRKDLPTTKLETGDAYFIEDEEKTVFWDGTTWREINAYVLNYNYNDASNKPLINGHVLSGDKSAAELELQPAGDYLTEIPEEYITEKELEDLDLADKNYVIDQINNTEHFHREIVDGLPVIGKDNVIYMVKKKSASGDDIYDEWMWVDTKYEHIGSTATDLSDYYKKEEADKLLDKKVNKVTGKGLSTNDYTTAEKTKLASLENYDDTAIKAELATLHNYDDTDIKNDITALKTAENGLKTDVSDIKEELKDKIEGVRLVRSGDMWDFYTVGGTRLTYEAARELLGHPNTILYMEGVENDGKTTPADYDIDEELIHVHYMDEDGEDRYLQMGYPNTASAEGSYIHIEDAVAQPLNSLTIEGKTEQKTTTGSQLYNINTTSIVSPNVSKTNDDWITVTASNTTSDTMYVNVFDKPIQKLKTSTNYTIVAEIKSVSYKGNDSNFHIFSYIASQGNRGQFLTGHYMPVNELINNSILVTHGTTLADFASSSLGLRTFVSIAPGNSVSITFRLSVLESLDITSSNFVYEKYTGYLPSPNPDYSQKIETITSNVLLNITGKNLLSYPYGDSTTTSYGITFTDNRDGSISINGTCTADNYSIFLLTGNKWSWNAISFKYKLEPGKYVFKGTGTNLVSMPCNVYYEDGTNEFINVGASDVSKTLTKKAKFNCRIIVLKKTTVNNITIYPMISREGGEYKPYIEEVVNIDLKGNELCSLPNGTKDELVIENNRVKINKKIGKIILDGKDNKVTMIGLHNGSRYITANIYNNSIAKIPEAAVRYTVSDKLRGASLGSTWAGKEYFTVSQANNGRYLQLCLPQSYKDLSFTTQESINNYLAANPITTYFLLAETKTIDLGEIDMPATFEGINNITTHNNVSPNIKVNYVTNVNYLDKNIGFKNHYIGYYEDTANLPTGNKGDIATVSSDKRIYINDGNEWIPSDKNSTIDLSNYLAKDNTTGYAPTGNYNPATKKYVDDSVKGINIPTKTSQLTNDSNFVIKTTNELINYYTKNNTYTKNEVNALVAGGSGGDSKIETLDITGGKDITALLAPGTHLYYLQGGEEDDLTLYAYYRDRDSYDTIHLYSGTLISVDYYVEAEDGEIHILYIDPQQGFGWLEYYGIPTKRTKLTNASVYDVGYIKASTNKLIANLLSNRINVVTEDTTISVYLNGSTSLTDLLLPTNTILIGKGIEFSGVMNTGGLIIKPDMTMYMITTSPLANLKVSELKLVTSDTLTSTLNNYATKSYADNCRLENSTPIEGTDIFGWYATTQDGTALTHATPQMIESIAIGEVYEWPSNVYTDGTNSAVVTSITKSYDHWSATRASGGESNYKEFIIYMGNHNVYTFAFDDTTVYKNYYPGDK